jgi:hypothetical protein
LRLTKRAISLRQPRALRRRNSDGMSARRAC